MHYNLYILGIQNENYLWVIYCTKGSLNKCLENTTDSKCILRKKLTYLQIKSLVAQIFQSTNDLQTPLDDTYIKSVG